MFVSRSMTSEVITITGDASIFEAQEKMAKHTIRHHPVIDEEHTLVGVVTDRDIRSVLPYSLFKDPDCAAGRE